MKPDALKGWSYYLGFGLLAFSVATLVAAGLTPLVFAPATAATIAVGALISSEVSFWAGAALLGKPMYDGLKAKLKGWFVRPTPVEPTGATTCCSR